MIAIHLRNLLPRIFSTLPEDNAGSANAFLFELAPSGVYLAKLITKFAVSSYSTISPLPASIDTGGIFSVALSPDRSGPPLAATLPYGVRTFLPPHTEASDCLTLSGPAKYNEIKP